MLVPRNLIPEMRRIPMLAMHKALAPLAAVILTLPMLVASQTTTAGKASASDRSAPVPKNLTFKPADASISDKYGNLIGIWGGTYRRWNGSKKQVRLIFLEATGPNRLWTLYCWGTYPDWPYDPGCSHGETVFDGDDGQMSRKVGTRIKDSQKIQLMFRTRNRWTYTDMSRLK